MKKLLLFDIDGTLISSPHNERFVGAIKNLHNLEIKSDRDFSGFTDQLILGALLEDMGWQDEQISKAMPRLIEELDRVHKESFEPGSVKIMRGVKGLLELLNTKGVVLGLITGNLEATAHTKLKDADIDHYFSVGGFGSDLHESRSDLVEIAIERAGYLDNKDQVYVIGDTPRDIQAAHEAGVKNTVGVTNGLRPVEELKKAGASMVFEDFVNADALIDGLNI
jgi:phosphoglycolate phosphatase-like HAD superfamily hydrolase